MIPYCINHGVGIIPWSPLAQGFLARPPRVSTLRRETSNSGPFKTDLSAEDRCIIDIVEQTSKRKGWTMARVSLAWLCSKVTSPIVGINNVCDDRIL